MTKGELYQIEKRVDEIEHILKLCIDGRDDDVVNNLMMELDNIIMKLTKGEKMRDISNVFIDEHILFDAKLDGERIEGQFEVEFDEDNFPIVTVLRVYNDFGQMINLNQLELSVLEGQISGIILETRGDGPDLSDEGGYFGEPY